MVQFLEAEPNTGEKIMQGLSATVQSIPDMLIGYNKSKQMAAFADYLQLPQEQKNAFLKLPSGVQEQLIPSLIAQAGQRKAGLEKIPKGSANYLKEFHPALHANPNAKQKIADLSQKYYQQGLPETEAYKAAIQEYRSPKQPVVAGKIEPQQQMQVGEEPQNYRDFFANLLTTAQKTPSPEHPMTTLERERPGGTLASLGLGAIAPLEQVLRYQSKAGMETAKSLGFTYPEGSERGPLVTEQLREKLHKGLSPEAIKATAGPEFAGAFLPIERIFGGMKLIGKGAQFLKNAEKLAAREGIEIAEAAQTIVKEAEADGIDIAKAAAGDKQEAGKLFNLSNRISAKAPETATEMRVARTQPKERLYPKEERIATREAQVKAFPKYEEEIATDAAERAARAEARVPKTVKGMDAKRIRFHEAEKNYPKAQESYNKAAGRVRALEDEVAKLSGEAKEHAGKILNLAKKDLDDATFNLKNAWENLEGTNYRATAQEMREAARKKMAEIKNAIEEGKEYIIHKRDYSPDMIAKAQAISKKKPIPKTRESDFYTNVHDVYTTEYKNRIAQIDKEMAASPKNLQRIYTNQQLKKEKDILEKMIKSAEAEKMIQNRRFQLRETAERHKAQERFKELKIKEGEPKVEKVAQENLNKNIKSYVENPTEEKVAEIAKEANVPPQAVKQGKTLVDAIKEVNQAAKAGSKPKLHEIKVEFQKFKEALKAKDWHELSVNPFSVGVMQILFDSILNETDLLDTIDLPGAGTLTSIAAGGRARHFFMRSALVYLYRGIVNNYKISKYVNAVNAGDDQKVSQMNRDYPRKLIKKAQARLEGS